MSGPPPTRGIRHVALLCGDIEEMERFYCDVLGYAVEWRPSATELYLTRGEDNLALHALEITRTGSLESRPEDVDAWAAYLREKGVRLDTEPRTHRDGARSFYVRDPEGNRLQFLYHPPISR
jgi:catechol 2,3-dioxygenase-like lactoylglutathione lyase family enzyme